MSGQYQFLDQARAFLQHYVPDTVAVPAAYGSAGLMVVLGLGLAVLGAKLARFSLTLAFAGAGAIVGAAVSDLLHISTPICAVAGGVVLGIVGLALHRLWVGLAAAVMFGSLAAGVVGYQGAWPHLMRYEAPPPIVATTPGQPREAYTDAELLSDLKAGGADLDQWWQGDFRRWRDGFRSYVSENEPGFEKRAGLITAGGALFGLLFGLIAARAAAVVMTSFLGTVMMLSGAGVLVMQLQPELYLGARNHPQFMTGVAGTILLGSLILQGLLSRANKSRRRAPKAAG